MRKASGILAFCMLLLLAMPAWAEDDSAAQSETANASTDVTTDAVALDCDPCSCGACEQCDPCDEAESGCMSCKVGPEFFGPLAIINQHPPTMLFLTPRPDVATVLPDGRSYLRASVTQTNNLIRELDSGIIADYDFETLRMALDYHVGTGNGEFSVDVPVIYRSHGFMDNLIADWHDWFGLPNGNRNKFPDYQYRYVIVTRQGFVFNDQGDDLGLGDITLGYKVPVYNRNDGRSAMAVRAGAKIPTGDPNQAMGSGNADFQLGALYQHTFGNRMRGYVNADFVKIGNPDWHNVGHQDIFVTLWALEYGLDKSTTAVAQYRTHVNPLVVGSFEADKDSQELALGMNRRLNDGLVWSWGFNEDLNPETAPDFVLYTDLKWEY